MSMRTFAIVVSAVVMVAVVAQFDDARPSSVPVVESIASAPRLVAPGDVTTPTEPSLLAPRQDEEVASSTSPRYVVINVVDGDTLDVLLDTGVERLRLIGINTPERVDPRKPVECFGIEASRRAKELLHGQTVLLAGDPLQGERDKYGRLLRYVFLPDGTNFNLQMIADGYAYEYTYNLPYQYQAEFKLAETRAREAGAGLWGALCEPDEASAAVVPLANNPPNPDCAIKGNISTSGEKIYHTINCDYYGKTKIDEARGEQWFCSEYEALRAGWRKARNCF